MIAPSFRALAPMLLTEVAHPFTKHGWMFEIKYDGWRCLAEVKDGVARVQSRRGFDLSRRWSSVVSSLASLSGHHIFDGEMCVLDDLGRSNFDQLTARSSPKTFCVFDLLVSHGVDIMSEPLRERKRQLAALLADSRPSVLLVSAIDTEGEWLYQHALALSLEGIVCKHQESLYLPGTRSPHWLKVKRPGAVPTERFRNSKGQR